MFDHVYTDPHAQTERQRAELKEYLAGSTTSIPSRRRAGRVTDMATTKQTVTLGKALNMGLRKAMEDDDKVVILGEDIGKLGGVFRITDGLQKDFGEHRVLDTPLAESGIVGTAVGLAMRGYRPVCEIQFDGFVFPAFDQIISQVAKVTYRTQGAFADAGGHPDPVRRRHRRGRASRRVAGVVLLPHRRAAGGGLREPAGCLRHDPGRHRAARTR